MGIFDYIKQELTPRQEFRPQDLAMLQAGAQMIGNAHQGFGPAFGSGVSAGLNEYRRGVSQAEQLRKNQKEEELANRRLDLSAGHLAEQQGFHTRSLDVQEDLARMRRELEERMQGTRIGAEKDLLNDRQGFEAWMAQKEHERQLRLSSSDDMLKMRRANLYDTENEMLQMQLGQLNQSLREGDETGKVNDQLSKRKSGKGLFDMVFGIPEAGQREPSKFFSGLTPEEMAVLDDQRSKSRRAIAKGKMSEAYHKKRIDMAIRNIQMGVPVTLNLSAEEKAEVQRQLSGE